IAVAVAIGDAGDRQLQPRALAERTRQQAETGRRRFGEAGRASGKADSGKLVTGAADQGSEPGKRRRGHPLDEVAEAAPERGADREAWIVEGSGHRQRERDDAAPIAQQRQREAQGEFLAGGVRKPLTEDRLVQDEHVLGVELSVANPVPELRVEAATDQRIADMALRMGREPREFDLADDGLDLERLERLEHRGPAGGGDFAALAQAGAEREFARLVGADGPHGARQADETELRI